MFERFTKEARSAVVLAQGEVALRHDTRVGSEHLLLGALIAAPDSVDGLSADDIRAALDQLQRDALASVGVSTDDRPRKSTWKKGHIPFTGAAKASLEQALREAILLGDREIGAAHIILGITSLPGSDRAIRALNAAGTDPGRLRTDLLASRRRSA